MSTRLIQELAVIACWIAIVLFMTWPIGDLAHPRLPDSDDAMFSVWRIAWVAHQLPRDPSHLFDTNIFYPATNTLAYSDAMLLLGVLVAPLIWAGIHPVVAHNLLLLAAFVGAGYAGVVLCRRVTHDTPASLLGGCVFAFAPYRFAHIGHLELLWTAFIPLAILACFDFLAKPGVATGARLGAMIALQGLSSVYYGVFLCLFLAIAVLVSPLHVKVAWDRKMVAGGLTALLVAIALLSPYAMAYGRAWHDLPARPTAEIRKYSAEAGDYLRVSSESEVYRAPPREGEDERSLFPGFVALLLAACAVLCRPSRRAAAYGILAVAAFDLSLGMNGIAYPHLVKWIGPLSSFRSPARFGAFVLCALSVLVALGTASLRVPLRRYYTPVVLALAAVMFVEYWSAPITARDVPLRPPVFYSWLARQPRTVVLELPVPAPTGLWLFETTYQYLSIYHWQPLVNGYSGNAPRKYFDTLEVLHEFPSRPAFRRIQIAGANLLVLHERYLGTDRFNEFLEVCRANPQFEAPVLFPDPEFGRVAACVVRDPGR